MTTFVVDRITSERDWAESGNHCLAKAGQLGLSVLMVSLLMLDYVCVCVCL